MSASLRKDDGRRDLTFTTRSKEGVAKAPKRMEPQRHEDTKSLPGWLKLRPAGKKVFLCAFVSLWFKAFMLFATASKVGIHSEPWMQTFMTLAGVFDHCALSQCSADS